MRSSQSFVVALLAGIFGLVPMNAVAQNKGFLVLPEYTAKKPTVHVVECKELKLGWNCTITEGETTCKPGECRFQKKAAADFPGILIYGVSVNSTCAWVYNGGTGTYYYHCW
jgi:hypothetical protein